MINAFLNGLLSFFGQVIDIVLFPINTALETLVPSTSNAFSYINQFWSLLSNYSGFVMSYTGLTTEVVSIIILLMIANLTIPLAVHGLKLFAKWWEVLI